MKNKRSGETNDEVRGQRNLRLNGPDSKKNTKVRKNLQRLGGRGLSLEAFANAKSRSSNYNPALIKKQREFYKNAKYVRKYKKSLKQDEHQSGSVPVTRLSEEQDQYVTKEEDAMIKKKYNKRKNGASLKELYENKREEKEKERLEREGIVKAKEEERKRSEAQRKALRAKMLKRTKTGQPVMKYRIEHLLETLEGSSTTSRLT
ncbi:hypothetical protein M9H77_01619 [Catharanthus roseus]|uniref:Uncharacterized protein n=1 Tax=Catharanthus roseus TaxID=4058 RepID=A0ACC0C610_CATRO|nr:hypothetical protein M9H77_01619 [Catharanthus roseus]